MTPEERLKRRIAAPEIGYPASEARFVDEAEYHEHRGYVQACKEVLDQCVDMGMSEHGRRLGIPATCDWNVVVEMLATKGVIVKVTTVPRPNSRFASDTYIEVPE